MASYNEKVYGDKNKQNFTFYVPTKNGEPTPLSNKKKPAIVGW